MFTKKELEAFRLKLRGLMNKEIAENLRVSESDISQTLSRLREKIKTVQDSITLLMEMGVIREGPKYVLTEKGRAMAEVATKKINLNWVTPPIGTHAYAWLLSEKPFIKITKMDVVNFFIYGEESIEYELVGLPEKTKTHFIPYHLILRAHGGEA